MEKFNVLPDTNVDAVMLANAEWQTMLTAHDDPINTTIGVMLDPATGKPWRPQAIEQSLEMTLGSIEDTHNYGYQGQGGDGQFLAEFGKFAFGAKFYEQLDGQLLGTQAPGGTGALTLAKETLRELVPVSPDGSIPLLLDDGWPNYRAMFSEHFAITELGQTSSAAGHARTMELIEQAAPNTVVLLQVCGYNDDGLDRSEAEWDDVLSALARRELPVILDSAYLGLAEDLEADSYAIRQAVNAGVLSFIATSSSKNMGLYNERVGALYIANAGEVLGTEQQRRLQQATNRAVRRIYSSPPLLGAKAVGSMLASPFFSEQYAGELLQARLRLQDNRYVLGQQLGERFTQILNGHGLFTKLLPNKGFTPAQLQFMKEEGVLALPSSRINLGGVAPRHIERLGETIVQALNRR
ncbi:MAG: aromatic amino acid aminotransferase [Candidatus Saccharibacteria bacterium]|nr:aromatic amino acid aminotransferase [Candidatus Saccharibacteria bacterium]